MPTLSNDANMKGWGPEVCDRRTAIVDQSQTKMYSSRADFVHTVTRDFVRGCQTPILVFSDDVPAHPLKVLPRRGSLLSVQGRSKELSSCSLGSAHWRPPMGPALLHADSHLCAQATLNASFPPTIYLH